MDYGTLHGPLRGMRRRITPSHRAGSPGILLLLFLYWLPALILAAPVAAQSPDWSATLLAPGFPSPFVSEWERNPQNLTLTLVHTGQGEREYRIEGVVRHGLLGEVGRSLSPSYFVNGVETVSYTAADLTVWDVGLAETADIKAAVRSGVLPEGRYEVCARVLTPQRIQLAEDCATFTIALPDAPQLVFPGSGDPVLTDQPTFQWTPVMLPPSVGVSYRLRIVPLHPTQTPRVALRANRPVHETELTGAPFYVYPRDGLPLEAGQEYVWQVEALDGMGQPLVGSGLRSEIWRFSLDRSGPVVAGPTLPDTLELVPGVARVIGLTRTDVRTTAFGYRLNGRARLEILAPFRAASSVRLQDVALDVSGTPRVTGGRIVGALDARAVPASHRGEFVALNRVEYAPGSGLVVGGELSLPGGPDVDLSGRAQVTAAGLYGVLTARGGEDLVRLGGDPVSFRVRGARVHLPGGDLELGGELELFGGAGTCPDVDADLSADGTLTAVAACAPDASLALGGTGARAEIILHAVAGDLESSLAGSSLDYDLTVQGGLYLDSSVNACSANLTLGLDAGGVALDDATTLCDDSLEPVAMDWLALGLSNLRLDQLDYRPGSGFDFAIRVDADPSVPTAPGLDLPTIPDIEVTRSGLSIPSVDVEALVDPVNLAGYRLRFTRMSLPGFALDWNDWEAGAAGDFDFALDGTIAMPSLPGAPCARTPMEASLRLAGGTLSASVDETFEDCRYALAEDLVVELDRLAGTSSVALQPGPEVTAGLELHGGLELPEAFSCGSASDRALPLDGVVRLSPDGGVTGAVDGLDPGCALGLGPVAVSLDQARLELGGEPGDRTAVLEGAGTGRFADLGDVTGTGSITVDLIAAEITDGSLLFQGPFQLDLPREAPVLSFQVTSARLDAAGLHLDGRNDLLLPGGETIGTTFDNVRFSLDRPGIAGGRILFDAPFTLDAGLTQTGELSWAASTESAPLALHSGVRVSLPSGVALDSAGLKATGQGGARLLYDGRDVTDLAADFSTAFALAFEPVGVADGRVDFRQNGLTLAYIDDEGFHPNLAHIGMGLLPERLGLPSEAVAYLQLRDGEQLNVSTEMVSEGRRIYTEPGATVPLVFPSLVAPGAADGTAPTLDIALDITLDPVTADLVDGSIQATVPAGVASPFDLSGQGVPFVAREIAYEADAAGDYALMLGGQLRLLDEALGQAGALELELTPGGRLAGTFALPVNATLPLVEGSGRLTYAVSNVEGSFDVGLLGGPREWSVDHDGTLELALGQGTPHSVAATLSATHHGLGFSDIEVGPGDVFQYFDLGPVRMGVANVRVPRVEHTPGAGWDFDLDMDLALEFPDLGGLDLPAIRDVRLGSDGFTIPDLSVPELTAQPFEFDGFSMLPLAFRMDPVHVDLFAGDGGLPSDWGFFFDFEISLGELPGGAPAGLSGIQISALDVGYRDGAFFGDIELTPFASPIALPAGPFGMAFNLLSLGGSLGDPADGGGIALDAAVSWTPPEFMRCDDASPELALNTGTFRLAGDGGLGGTATGLVPTCPVQLGPLALQVTDSDLTFSYAPGGTGTAELALDGTARLPGAAVGDTISAAGSLTMDLLEPAIVNGRIDIDQPFRWDLPGEQPFLRLVVNQGRLDPSGLTLSGLGGLRLGDAQGPATVDVAFSDLSLSLKDFAITGGTAVFQNDFALDVALNGSALAWSASPAGEPRPTEDGFRFTVPTGAVLDSAGLQLTGQASAELAYADSVFAALQVVFEDDFRLGTGPVGVEGGRAGFIYNDTEVAYVDPTGFWPGDIFGVLPIPARLPLPTEEVAYVELRDPQTDSLLISSTTTVDGLQLTGDSLRVVIPALAGDSAAPQALVSFTDVVVDPTSYAVVSGSLEVAGADGAPLFGLSAAYGIPLDINALRYGDDGSGYRLTADARVDLPEALTDAILEIRDMEVTEAGLPDEVRLGTFQAGYDLEQDGPLVDQALTADVGVRLHGARAHFVDEELELAGSLTLAPFADSAGQRTPVPFTALAAGSGFSFAISSDSIDGGVLDLGVAEFEPRQVDAEPGIALEVSDSLLAVRLAGEVRIPELGEDFAVTLSGLEVGTHGVVVPAVALTAEQQFTLFGATFTLKSFQDTPEPGLGLAYDGNTRTFMLTMSGEIALPILDQTPRFRGFQVGTDGTLALAHASLISDTVDIVPDVLALTALTIEDARLRTDFAVDLPAPLDGGGTQAAHFAFGADGTVEGGGNLVLLDNDTDDQGLNLGVATVHLRYLDLVLDAGGSAPEAAVRAIADVDMAGSPEDRVNIGWMDGGTVRPGLVVGTQEGVTWANTRLQDSVRLPIPVVDLTIRDVSLAGAGEDLTLGLSGDFSMDIPGLAGGIGFSDFRIDRNLETDFSGMTVSGGHLTLASAVSIEVSSFAYSDTETTIQVADVGMPASAGDSASTETRDVLVSSYVDVGGRVGVGPGCSGTPDDCLFSGGVDRIQFYRTAADGLTSFVVRDAQIDVGRALSMSADLMYREGPSQTFELALGGNATIMEEYGATVVGVFDNTDPNLRAGLFVAVSAPIPIAPPLTLQQVGGGFFYNARPEHLDMVQQAANLSAEATGSFSPATGEFTGLLYAAAAIGGEDVATGRVLLTVSEINARLQGDFLLLPDGGFGGRPVASGYADVFVGFREKFVEGNLGMDVELDPIATGGGGLEFYVYGPDAWGVFGEADLTYVQLVSGSGEFFVGSPGFMVSGNLSAGFDFWIVSVSGTMDASMWYQRDPLDLGAYMSVKARASLLGGTVSGSGTLRGALLAGNNPLIYAGALAEGCITLLCADANIWAKFQNGSVSGGFGSDPTMEEIVARANSVRDGMTSARESMQQNVSESRPEPASVALTDEEIAQIYQDLDRSGPARQILNYQRQRERDFWSGLGFLGSSWTTVRDAEQAHFAWYNDLVHQAGMPRNDSQEDALAAAVEARLDDIDALQPTINQKLSGIQISLVELESLAAEPWPESPVMSASFQAPQTQTTVNPDGTSTKSLESGPGFAVDADASTDIKDDLAQRQARTDALLQQVRDQIDELEDGLASVQSVMVETGDNSLARFAELHTDAITAAQEQYARQGDLVLRQHDWYNAGLSQLANRYSGVRAMVTQKSSIMGMAGRVRALARSRLQALDQLEGGGGRVAEFDAVASTASGSWIRDQADTLGLQLWYHMARAGMEAAEDAASATYNWIRSEQNRRVNQMWLHHSALTQDLDRLSTRKAELVGTLYDMYDRYDFWLDGALEAGDSAAVVAERNRVAGRMSTLEEELQVPTVSTATVITVNQGYMAQELMITSGSHPRTPYEYLYNSAPGGSVNFAWGLFLMQSSGRERFVTRYSLIPSLNTTSEERTFRAGVRAGAGYVGLGRASYTTSYAEGPNYSSATLSTDNSPPTTPEVEVKVGPDWVDSDVTNAWTADATQLDVRWDAADSHSGIGEYEYAIGTGAQRTSIRDWTSAGGRTEMSIYGLDLVPNAANYVYVRARNGSGTWGGVGRSAPVLYDPTPPTFDPGAALIDAANVQIDEGPASDPFALNGLQPESSTTDTGDGATGEAEAMQWPTSACEVTSPSRGSAWYAGMSGTQAGGTRVVPEDLTLLIPPARDDGSGIQRYYYRVTDGAPAGPFRDGDGWTAVTGGSAVTVAGEDLDYRDGTYVSVVAMNRAGLVSEPLVAVHQPQDPTPPAGLDFCVGQDAEPGRLALKFASPARDRESGIRGYQYRVRSASGGVIRDWSPTDSVDFSGIGTGDVFRTPDLGVGDGAGVSVDVRVSNHQGQWQWVSSGPLAVDYSAPPRPSGDVLEVVGYGESQTDQSYGGLFRLPQSTSTLPIALRVQITAPDDPESGLAYQQWAVLPASEAGTRDPFAGIVQEEKTGVWLLPGFGSSDPASAMGGIIGGARAGTYMTELRASGLDALHDAAPGTEYRLYLRTVNTRGVVSQQYEVRFHLPKSDQGTVAEENGR